MIDVGNVLQILIYLRPRTAKMEEEMGKRRMSASRICVSTVGMCLDVGRQFNVSCQAQQPARVLNWLCKTGDLLEIIYEITAFCINLHSRSEKGLFAGENRARSAQCTVTISCDTYRDHAYAGLLHAYRRYLGMGTELTGPPLVVDFIA